MISADWVQAVASVFTLFAAGLAVWATMRAPTLAAEYSEKLRVQSSQFEEQRKLKLYIFTTLLQNRASIASHDSVSALNLIDMVFISNRNVRDAWNDFYESINSQEVNQAAVIERYFQIIAAISRDLGMSDQITISDIRKVYIPISLGQQRELQIRETEARLRQLRESDA